MNLKPPASSIQPISEALQWFLAEAVRLDPRGLAEQSGEVRSALDAMLKTLLRVERRYGGVRRHSGMGWHDPKLPPNLRRLHECVRNSGDRTVGRSAQAENFHRAVSIVKEIIVSDFGNGTVVVKGGNEEIRFHIPGTYTYERVSGGVKTDDGRSALLEVINDSLGRCGDILSDAEVDVSAYKDFADRKSAAFKGMLRLIKEVKRSFAPEIIEYAQFEEADDYDESIITSGIGKLSKAVFVPYGAEIKACRDLLGNLGTEISYPTDLTKKDLIEGVPPSLHDLVEWFMPNERDRVVTVADMREVVEAGTSKVCKHMTAVGNKIARRQRAGSAGVNPKRSNRENALLKKVRDIVAKNVKAGRKPNVSAACDFVQRNTKNSPFATKEQLRNRYNDDRDQGYLAF